jgi:hypothetical protein
MSANASPKPITTGDRGIEMKTMAGTIAAATIAAMIAGLASPAHVHGLDQIGIDHFFIFIKTSCL